MYFCSMPYTLQRTALMLRELGLFSLEKRWLQGDIIEAFQYLKKAYKQEEDWLFTQPDCDRTRRDDFKLKKGIFRLDAKQKFLTIGVVRHGHRMPREVVDALSLETFKSRLDGALGNLI